MIISPSVNPSGTASVYPSSMPSESPSKAPSEEPSSVPTSYPTETLSNEPIGFPSLDHQRSDLMNPDQIHHQAQVCLYYQDIGRHDPLFRIVLFVLI